MPLATKTVNACVQQSRYLLVDIDIDRSASLLKSDPQGRRADGIDAALSALMERTEPGGQGRFPAKVEVLFSSFAGDATPLHPQRAWHPLDRGSIHRLRAEARRYKTRANGRDTDYVTALIAAQRALNSRASEIAHDENGREACKLLLFLSDGRFELGDRTGAVALPPEVFYAKGVDLRQPGAGRRAVALGRSYLCHPGGLMDRIVHDRIVMFTVALSASGGLSPAARRFLEAITTGGAKKETCGVDLSRRTGEFTEVRDNRDLLFALGSLGGPEALYCRDPRPCPNPYQFVAIPGLSGFSISASARPGEELALSDPADELETLSSDEPAVISLGGASIHQRWTLSRSARIEASFDPRSRAWLGPWRFLFSVPGEPDAPVPVYSVALKADLSAEIADEPKLVRGRMATIDVDLVDHRHVPVSKGRLVRSARLVADVVDSSDASRTAEVNRVGGGKFKVSVPVPTDAPGGDWRLNLETRFATSETPVEPTFESLPLPAPEDPAKPPILQALALVAAGLLAIAGAIAYWRARDRARFTPARHLRILNCDAVIRAGERLELSPDPGQARYGSFERLGRRGSSRGEHRIESGIFSLRTHIRWRGDPFGEATSGKGKRKRQIVGGKREGGRLTGLRHDRACEAPLDLIGIWLFAIEMIDADDNVYGKLAVFTVEQEPKTVGSETLNAARKELVQIDWGEFDREPVDERNDHRDDFGLTDDDGWSLLP